MKKTIFILMQTFVLAQQVGFIDYDWGGHLGYLTQDGILVWNKDWESNNILFDGTWSNYPRMYGSKIEEGYYSENEIPEFNDSLKIRSNFMYDQGDYLLDRFSNRLGDVDKDPFIGYFGNEYELQKKKVMFLGRSNAESAAWGQDDDRQINKALRIFRDCADDHAEYYRNYADEYVQAMDKWSIYQNFVKYFLDNTNLDIHKVAYANIVPFRYKKRPTTGAFEIAFENFTNEIISIFKPDIIIPLGINDERLLKRFLPTEQLDANSQQ